MKINKRECRKYINPGFTINKNNGLLLVEQVKHIVRTAVRNISGKRVLILYFYNREKAVANAAPEYTLFQCRDDYIISEQFEDGANKWRSTSLDNLGRQYIYFTKTCAFYRQRDEEVVTRFCRYSSLKGFAALNVLQTSIMKLRLIERIKARERKTIERMKPIPSVPRGLKGWIHREVLPHYVYYIYKRSKKPMQGYCTACRHDVQVSRVKHNETGKCPHCRKTVTFKASGRTKCIFNRATVQVLQKMNGNELILRIFKVTNTIYDYRKPRFSVWENARFFIRRDGAGKMMIEPYYYSYNKGLLTRWQRGERPRLSQYQYSFECDTCGHLYCGNLDSALTGTPWQYSQLGRFYHLDGEPLEVLPYLSAYNKYPALEYLVKLGFSRLVSQLIYKYDTLKVINANGRNLRETLGIEPEDLNMLQKLNVTAHQLELYQTLRTQEIRASEQLLVWYLKCDIVSSENVVLPLKYSTQTKFMRYIDEQFERLKDWKNKNGVQRYAGGYKNILSDYKDYIYMGEKLSYDFTDSFVVFPKNLPEAHDTASKLYDAEKQKIFNEQIKEAYKGLLAQYRLTKSGLTLIPPKTAKEIVDEGHTLHHCVSSYVERVAAGECIIFFIRKTDNVKEPFYTLELRNGRVVQIHGKHHQAPTPEVSKFLEMWKKTKLQAVNMAEAG